MNAREAASIVSSLRVGDRVIVGTDGRDYEMAVTHFSRSDGEFGSWESYGAHVTLGPGRWSTKVDASAVASGRFTIRPLS